jgi:hypothetical protein
VEKKKKSQNCSKDMQIEIAFRMQNTIKHHPRTDKHNKCGFYQMKYLDCSLKYLGQTGRTFHTRYREHIQAIRNSSALGYSSHI